MAFESCHLPAQSVLVPHRLVDDDSDYDCDVNPSNEIGYSIHISLHPLDMSGRAVSHNFIYKLA